MTKTLRIEVTEGMREAAIAALMAERGKDDWLVSPSLAHDFTAALTAAFQHPEFVEQIRRQVLACVDEVDFYWPGGVAHIHYEQARANLAGLLGVEHG